MHPNKFLKRQAKPEVSSDEKLAQLEKLGDIIAGKRKDAVDARKESGIETIWLACEEAYIGMDDMNRHEFAEARWAKPTSMAGPLTSNRIPIDEGRSNVFVRMTSRYVDHGVSKLCEILLPIDEKAFHFDATPVPELIEAKDDERTVAHDDGTPMMRKPEEAPVIGQTPAQPPVAGQPPAQPVPIKVKDFAQENIDIASDCAKKAETRIYDWMVESKYPAECRKVAHDAGRIGVGVLKGPFPDIREDRAVVKSPKGITLEIKQSIVPALKWVDPWNIFPNAACGENIHDGDDIFERDYLSEKKLKKLKQHSDYLSGQIDKVITEGPGKIYADGGSHTDKKSKKRYEVWYWYGVLKRSDMEVANAVGIEDVEQEEINAIVTMVNDTVIKAVINPLDSGSFPYRVMSWSRRPGHWAGVGIGEGISAPQRMANASTRALLNNAGLTAGPQIIIDQIGIVPADGSWKLTPNKIWYKTGESTASKVSDAFFAVIIPSVQKEMAAIIEYAMRLAEESSGIPLVTQGQVGPTTPQTFGQAELQNNNSLTWLRSVGYRFDDMITEPLVNDMYEWLLLDPEVPEEEKGDFNINAHGSAAMVERAIQEQTVMGLLGASANPEYRINPPKLFALMLKSKRIDPREVQYSDEEFEKLPKASAPLPVMVEQVKGQNALQLQQVKDKTATAIAQGHDQVTVAKTKEDTDRDRVFVEAEAERTRNEYTAQMAELQMRERLAMLDYSNKHQITIEQIKAKLADTSMRLNVQKDLSVAAHTVELHKHHNPAAVPEVITPPTEPAGRAENGQAFAQ